VLDQVSQGSIVTCSILLVTYNNYSHSNHTVIIYPPDLCSFLLKNQGHGSIYFMCCIIFF